MANELDKISQAPEKLLILSDRTKAIVKVVQNANDCVAFKMDAREIIHWSREIERLVPGIDPKAIGFVLDCFKVDILSWDRNKGIQNIFNGLKRIGRNEDGSFYLKETFY